MSAPTCQSRPTSALCQKRASYWLHCPEGEQPDQWACSHHKEQAARVYRTYRPGKGGVVVYYRKSSGEVVLAVPDDYVPAPVRAA